MAKNKPNEPAKNKPSEQTDEQTQTQLEKPAPTQEQPTTLPAPPQRQKGKAEKELEADQKRKAEVDAHNTMVIGDKQAMFEAECKKGPLSPVEKSELASLERRARMGRQQDQPNTMEMERLAVLRIRNKES